MEYVKVVLGANMGDEGKGMMTHYFSKNAEGKVLNILFNGGVQRGHTVNGHIFHCFGSGTFDGADTFYHKDFMINPIGYYIERKELSKYEFCNPKVYMDEKCRITLPYDMYINRAIEEKRGKNRHGSCGMGILETRLRSEQYPIYAEDLNDQYELYHKLRAIEEKWVPERCKELGIDIIDMSGITDNFLAVSNIMMKSAVIKNFAFLEDEYDTIIYEGGQGLLLSEDNTEFAPHLTPSFTGSQVISREINKMKNVDVEVCYVTRPYITRHGAGPLPTECNKEDINKDIIDKTNIPNVYQESLRFGYLDVDEMVMRINKDFRHYDITAAKSLAVTQMNYTDGKLVCGPNKLKDIPNGFDAIYEFWEEI